MLDFSNYQRFKSLYSKTILSIDFGYKVIGTALFTPGRDPFPLPAQKILYQSDERAIEALQKIIDEESVEVIVLGVPYFIDGQASDTTLKIKAFGDQLKKAFPSLLYFEQDETLTTKAAEERMKNSAQYNFKVDPTQIDVVAATIILEDFLRS